MQNKNMHGFPLVASFLGGLSLMVVHARFLVMLSFFPFGVTLLTMILLRVFRSYLSIFLIPVLQMPSSVVIGLQCALVLRFLLLQEMPVITEGQPRADRNRVIFHAAVIYATINYLVSGAYAGLLKLQAFYEQDMEAAAPYMPLGLLAMVGIVWATRWFWLHIPVALEWPMQDFYARVGRWSGSLRIFVLFGICSLTVNFVASGFNLMVVSLFGESGGFSAAFQDSIVSLATIVLALLFTLSSSVALQYLSGKPPKEMKS